MDPCDITTERAESAERAAAKAYRYAPPETREGRCEECGGHHPRLAVQDGQWRCAPCRELNEQKAARRYGVRTCRT